MNMNQIIIRTLCLKHITMLGAFLAALCLAPVETTYAMNSAAGKVVFVKGDVIAVDNSKKERKLTSNSAVFSGDLIKTSAEGRIQMRFKDGSFMSLIPASEFLIEDYSYGESKKKEKGAFSLIKGGLRTLSGLLRKDRYNIKTPVATIGLRGTWFNAEMIDATKLLVRVGFDPRDPTGVELANSAGKIVLERGQAALVSGSGSLPQVIADAAVAESSSVASADSILNVVAVANIPQQANPVSPIVSPVVIPVVRTPDLEDQDHINSFPSGGTCLGSTNACGMAVNVNAAISKPTSATTVESSTLTEAGVLEHFRAHGGHYHTDELTVYGKDGFTNNVAISTRPNKAENLLTSPAVSGNIANSSVGAAALAGTGGFLTEAGHTNRTALVEYQRVENMSGADVPLSWARWTNDTILSYSNGAPSSAIDLPDQSVHAVFGEGLNNSISTLGAGNATYYLVGGTTPTSFDGLSSGTLKSGSIQLDFASSSMDMELVVNHPAFASSGQTGNADFNMTGNNIGVTSVGTFTENALSVISSGCVGCSGNVNGLFSGDDASGPLSAGMTYQITDGVEGITGAAGFERQ